MSGSTLAKWPGDKNTGKLYAVKHNPFPYVAKIQDNPAEFAKQVTFDQLFSDLNTRHVPALPYILPGECRDMHGLGNTFAPYGGSNDTDANDIRRGDDETFWLVNAIMGSPAWKQGPNAIFVVFDEGYGPLTCPGYSPDPKTDTASYTVMPGAHCSATEHFSDKVVFIAITKHGVRGVRDDHAFSHYSLLTTIEAAFNLPYIGQAADRSTRTLAPLLAPADE